MKLYWIVVRIVMGWLLIKLAMDTGWWVIAGLALLVCLSAMSEFFQRLAWALRAMKE